MKKILTTFCLATGIVSLANAAPTSNNSQTDSAQSGSSNQSSLIDTASLVGQEVRNPQGQSLGHIEKLLTDPASGRIRYAVIQVDKTWNWNDPRAEVPFQALQIQTDNNGKANVVLDSTRDKLEKAPKFQNQDQNRFSQREASEPLYSYWAVVWYDDTNNGGAQNSSSAGQGGESNRSAASSSTPIMRFRDLVDSDVMDSSGKKIGRIEDVFVDENTGRIHMAALKLDEPHSMNAVVSWNHISPANGGNRGYTVDLDQAALAQAPHFDTWDAVNNDWLQQAAGHWNMQQEIAGKKLVRATEVRDGKLFDQNGNQIGSINGLLANPERGVIGFAVVRLSNASDSNKDLTAVPFEMIRQSPGSSPGYVFHGDTDALRNAPSFGANSWPDYNQTGWRDSIRSRFGVASAGQSQR
jgi:sporulation protein YlmC with PRC-barrel domain